MPDNDLPEEKTVKTKRQKLIRVTVLSVKGQSALVEWVESGAPHRAYLPISVIVEEGNVPADDLASGIPYGVAWEIIELTYPTGVDIARALRNANIWTRDDLHKHPGVALAALQNLFGAGLVALIQCAEKENKQE